MDKILVTGASGFVGRHLAKALKTGSDAEIVCLARSQGTSDVLQRLGYTVVRGDMQDADSLMHATAGVSTIIHLASLVSNVGHHSRFISVNVTGTANLLQAAARHGTLRHCIYMSSIAVYDGIPIGTVTETAETPLSGWAYADSKKRTEALVRAARYPFPVTIVRAGDVLGSGSVWVRVPLDELKSHMFMLVARNRGLMNYIWIDDLVNAIQSLLSNEGAHGRTYNLTSGDTVLFDTYFRDIASAAGYTKVPTVPKAVARILARANSLRGALWGRSSEITPAIVDYITAARVVDGKALHDAVNWKPRFTYADIKKSLYTDIAKQ